MTTPDKEEMPRTAGNFWAEKRDGRWQLQMRHRGPGSSFCVAQINHWADNSEALTTRIANACNAYEPMKEALNLSRDALEQARLYIEGDEETHGRQFGDGNAVRSALAKIDAALSTLHVNDRQTSDDVGILRELLQKLADAIDEETISRGAVEVSLEDRHRDRTAHRRLENAYISALCATSEAVRQARAALKGVPQPASEAGKLSTDEVL